MGEMKRVKAEREREGPISPRIVILYPRRSPSLPRALLDIPICALSLIDAGHEKFLSVENAELLV